MQVSLHVSLHLLGSAIGANVGSEGFFSKVPKVSFLRFLVVYSIWEFAVQLVEPEQARGLGDIQA